MALLAALNEPQEFLPNGFYAGCTNLEKLEYFLTKRIEANSLLNIFANEAINLDETTGEVTQCIDVLTVMSRPEERFEIVKRLISITQNKYKDKQNLLERLIIKIIYELYERKLISLGSCCELLIINTDYKFNSPMDGEKFKFIHERLKYMDYKEMRTLLRILLIDKMDLIPSHLTEYHRQQMQPMENLILDLLDRKNNFIPALFIVTELFRLLPTSKAYLFPRISRTIAQIVLSFRPLAEITSVVCRSWLYPILSHVGFSAHNMTWRFDEESKYLFKAHLPYSTENLSVQTYFQTSIFRQPRGQILLHNYNKPQTSVSIFPTIDVCKDAILQAMYLIEESTIPINDPANQYTWLHLNHFVIYTCHIGCSSFEDLTSVLKTYLTTNPYKKARGELMWLFLQFIAFKNKDMTLNIMNNIADIYRLLYTEEQSWSGSGMDIQIMVKFFAPASIWVQFQHRFRDGTVEPPSEALRIQINHFKKEIKNNQSLHDGMLIVLANSFSNNREIFENQIYSTLSKQLEADPHDEPWLLPYGFKAEGRCKAVELVSIDCFTFHARDFLFQYMRRVFHKMSKNVVTMPPMVSGEMNVTQKMPSPASIESIVRIILAVEVLEQAAKSLVAVGQHFVNEPFHEYLFILTELFNYRILTSSSSLTTKFALINLSLNHMQVPNQGPYVLSNLMYSAFEQLILKMFTWTSQSDIVKMSTEVIKHSLQESKKKDKNPRLQFYGIPEIFTSDTTGPGFNVCPEIVRIFSLNYVRSMKMTGIESASAMTAITSLNFYFPASANAYFNNGSVVYKTCEGMPEEKTKFMVDQLDQDQLADHISSEKEYLHRNPRGNTIFVVIYRALFANSQKQMNPTFYKVLENINIKEIINSVNLFVDYLIYKWSFGIYTPDEQDKCIKILNDMVFHYQVFHFDRLFISLVMHANDDKSIETSILIIHQLVTKHEDLKQRLNYILAFSPSKQSIPSADSETFFKTMTDYYKKFPENTYPELYAKSQNEDPTLLQNQHYPIYYGTLADKILPLVDMLLTRALQTNCGIKIIEELLVIFAPIYIYHGLPLNFLYRTIFTLDHMFKINRPSIQLIVRKILSHLDEKSLFSERFLTSPGKEIESMEFCTDLLKKLVESCTYKHEPPKYVTKDWRLSELPPAGQTLHACVIEIMTTEIEPVEIIKCFIELGLHSTSKIPYEHLNAVGLLISALPKPYYDEFLELVIGFFDLEFLRDDADVELVFANLNTEVYHYSTPKIIAHLAIVHSVLQHAPASLLTSIPDMFKSRMLDAVNNECQLFFAIRIIVIVMAKISDIKDRVKKQLEYLALTILIYELTAKIGDKNRKPLKKEDALIDVLYNLKYAYVGDSVRDLAEQCLAKTHGSLQEKAKFIHKGVVQSNLHGKTKNLLNVVSAQDQQYLQQQPLYQTKPEEVPEYQQPSRNISFNNQMPMHNFGNTSNQIINPINAMSAMNTLSTGPLMNMGNISGPSSNMTMMLQSPKPSPSNFDVDKSYKEQEAAKRHYEMSNPMEREKHELAIKQDHERAMHANTMNQHSRQPGRLGSRDEFLRSQMGMMEQREGQFLPDHPYNNPFVNTPPQIASQGMVNPQLYGGPQHISSQYNHFGPQHPSHQHPPQHPMQMPSHLQGGPFSNQPQFPNPQNMFPPTQQSPMYSNYQQQGYH